MDDNLSYYSILGIKNDSSPDELKRAYRKLAMQYHPDKCPGEEAARKFHEVSTAYQVLVDPEKRNLYDQYGLEGLGDMSWQDPYELFKGVFGKAGVFEEFFGGKVRQPAHQKRGDDITTEVTIDLQDTLNGCERSARITRLLPCERCSGTGRTERSKLVQCTVCGGTGRVSANVGKSLIHNCPNCAGHGQVVSNPCPPCRGSGFAYQETRLKLYIPPGVENGSRLRNKNGGDHSTSGGENGSLFIHINVTQHPFFSQKGRDLYGEITVPILTILTGGEVIIPTLTGTKTITISQHTKSGQYLEIPNEGTRSLHKDTRGSIFIKVNYQFPEQMEPEDIEILKNVFEKYAR